LLPLVGRDRIFTGKPLELPLKLGGVLAVVLAGLMPEAAAVQAAESPTSEARLLIGAAAASSSRPVHVPRSTERSFRQQRGHDPIQTVVTALATYLTTAQLPPLPAPKSTSDG